MRKKWLIGLAGGSAALTVTLLALVGCGGGGGPITAPNNPPSGPSISADFQKLWPAGQKGSAYVGTAACLGCHGTGGTATIKMDTAKWNTTKHAQLSVGCEQCHGPGANHAAAPADFANNILMAPVIADSVVCGQCHGPTFQQYNASSHSIAVEDVMSSAMSNPTGERTCLRCHSGKLRADLIDNTLETGSLSPDQIDANINALTADQLLTYVSGPHDASGNTTGPKAANGQPLLGTHESPTCANCHDPHYTTGKLTWQGNEVQLLRQQGNTDDSVVGQPNTPVKLTNTFDHTCAVCHMSGTSKTADGSDNALKTENSRGNQHEGPQYYMLSGHGGSETITQGAGPNGTALPSPPVVRRTAHFDIPGQCGHCHMPNGSHTWTVNLDVSCQPCHTPADAQARTAIRGEIQLRLVTLRNRMETWAKAKFGDPDLWYYSSLVSSDKVAAMTTINNRPYTDPLGVPLEIRRARHNYIDILMDASFGIHNPAYTRYMLDIANTNLDALGVARAASIGPSQAQLDAILKADRLRALKAPQTDF